MDKKQQCPDRLARRVKSEWADSWSTARRCPYCEMQFMETFSVCCSANRRSDGQARPTMGVASVVSVRNADDPATSCSGLGSGNNNG